jgi:hypothetical protein
MSNTTKYQTAIAYQVAEHTLVMDMMMQAQPEDKVV